jgi:AICAR transformylase/IMP cyclohydrolase PurH
MEKVSYITVTPVRKSTGVTAPKIMTNVVKTKHPKKEDLVLAIKEAKEKSRLSDFEEWNYRCNVILD